MLRRVTANKFFLHNFIAVHPPITTAKIIVEPDLDRMAEAIKAKTGRMIYAVTCFSDKEKLYERVTLDPDSVK